MIKQSVRVSVFFLLIVIAVLLPRQAQADWKISETNQILKPGQYHVVIFAENVNSDLRLQTVDSLIEYYGEKNVLSWTEYEGQRLQYLYAYPVGRYNLMKDLAPDGVLTPDNASSVMLTTVCPSLHKDPYYQGQSVSFCHEAGSGVGAGYANLGSVGFDNVATSNLMPYGYSCWFILYDSTNYNNKLTDLYSNNPWFSSGYNDKTTSAIALCQ